MWKLACSVAALALSALLGAPMALAQGTSRGGASRVSAHVKPCRAPKHHKVLADTRDLVMWSVERHGSEIEFEQTVFACMPPRGRTVVVGRAVQSTPQGGTGISVESAGSFIAVETSSGDAGASSEELTLDNVRDGRSTEIVYFYGNNTSAPPGPTPEPLDALGPPFGFGIDEFAVDANGDVAWVGSSEPAAGKPGLQVLYVDDARGIHRVAATTTLELLGFRRGQVRWTESARA